MPETNIRPLPAVWAHALQLAHGDKSLLHVESTTVVWVGVPVQPAKPRRRTVRKPKPATP